MNRNVTVRIDPLGNPTIEANNFAGASCTEATKPIEDALTGGGGSYTRDLKGEYYASEEAQTQQHQSWG